MSESATEPFEYRTQGRSRFTYVALGIAAVLLLWAQFVLGASPWITGAFALFTIPAILDVIRNPQFHFRISDQGMEWSAPEQDMDLALSRITKIRLDTRLDLSVRVTLHLTTGAKLRLPPTVVPPAHALEQALSRFDLKYERHHFRLF